jgi:hypothetical protein
VLFSVTTRIRAVNPEETTMNENALPPIVIRAKIRGLARTHEDDSITCPLGHLLGRWGTNSCGIHQPYVILTEGYTQQGNVAWPSGRARRRLAEGKPAQRYRRAKMPIDSRRYLRMSMIEPDGTTTDVRRYFHAPGVIVCHTCERSAFRVQFPGVEDDG